MRNIRLGRQNKTSAGIHGALLQVENIFGKITHNRDQQRMRGDEDDGEEKNEAQIQILECPLDTVQSMNKRTLRVTT